MLVFLTASLFFPSLADRLVRVAGDVSGCCVCEVGPGTGALTRSILNAGASKVVVVEKDKRFLPSLDVNTCPDLSHCVLLIKHDQLKDLYYKCGTVHNTF